MEEEVEKQEKTSKKGNFLIIIIVAILAVLLLVIVGIIGYLFMSSPSDEANAPTQAAPVSKNAKANVVPSQRGSDFANIGQMFALAPFTLNLLSDSGARYVKCTIQLEQNTELLTPELEKKIPVIRDIIIRTLTSKTFEEVSTTKGKERLKDELVGKINEVLTDGFIKNIYFMDFVVS
ncbi:flagellar basal body-associated protein FliL [Campylobacter sp. US33a]|uniref:Flagellar protein FliL n=1 Tax=Campylobacter sp. CCS1377 TaxID=3158229 RepID=A0AAU7E6Y3_9BACT|nr:flagellar basal body-associated protein FliL [Campylobacter sp. US33a]MCW1361049.1 flagellar basal body-associated protein FliL [Campylobacter jejuni]TEY01985.1 flagellar basal body-associated protein FliL [Campylobacter sp. US33a]